MRALGRAGTLALAGAAAGYVMRKRGLLGQSPGALAPAPAPPSEPLFVPQAAPPAPATEEEHEDVSGEVEEVDAPTTESERVPEEAEVVEPEPEPELNPDPKEVVQPPAADEERPDVAAVVDDLLGGEGAMTEASAVMSEDARLAEAVRVALAETPGLLSAPIDIEVEAGQVTLHGELDRPEAITAVERKAESVDGVRVLRSLLHLPGTPAPGSG